MSNKETKTSNKAVSNEKKKEVRNMSNKETKGVLTLNLATAKEDTILKAIATALDSIAVKSFEVGVYGAYLNGVIIPSYTTNKGVHVPTMHRDSMKITEIVNNKYIENKSRTTVSRMVGAVRRLTDDDTKPFELFASGKLPFTYDKIYLFYDNIEVMKNNGINTLEKAFTYSVGYLKDLAKKSNDSNNNGDDDEMVNFTYNKKTYSVKKSAIDNFLLHCTLITKGKN